MLVVFVTDTESTHTAGALTRPRTEGINPFSTVRADGLRAVGRASRQRSSTPETRAGAAVCPKACGIDLSISATTRDVSRHSSSSSELCFF